MYDKLYSPQLMLAGSSSMLNKLIFFSLAAVGLALVVPSLIQRPSSPAPAAVTLVAQPEPEVGGTDAAFGRAILAADARGHFNTTIYINGQSLKALVDTGATTVALRYSDARSLGLIVPGARPNIKVNTANGSLDASRVRLSSVRVGSITAYDIDAMVLPDAALRDTLLGMSFLGKLRKFEINNGRLVLEK
jgi:aspartyl protease family protein